MDAKALTPTEIEKFRDMFMHGPVPTRPKSAALYARLIATIDELRAALKPFAEDGVALRNRYSWTSTSTDQRPGREYILGSKTTEFESAARAYYGDEPEGDR